MRRRRIALAVAACGMLAGPATADAICVPYRAVVAAFEIGSTSMPTATGPSSTVV
jgi:hypothetical protein